MNETKMGGSLWERGETFIGGGVKIKVQAR